MVLHNDTDIYNVPFKKERILFHISLLNPRLLRAPHWAPKMLHSITMTLCLRYTEVDQTFGWARLAMGLK